MFMCEMIENLDLTSPMIPIPDAELFPADEPNFTNVVSTMMLETMISDAAAVFRLGTSSIGIRCMGMISQGPDGIRELRTLAKTLLSAIETAAPQLPSDEADYFGRLIDDYKHNGLDMPFHGRIALD